MFQLDPELESFREDARKMAERAFAAKAAYWDEEEIYPTENLRNTAAPAHPSSRAPSCSKRLRGSASTPHWWHR